MGHIYIQYGTSFITVWDIYIYSMGHLSMQYGTYLITGWDTLSIQDGNLYMQYVTVITVWDIYLYGTCSSIQYGTSHLSIQYGIYISIQYGTSIYSMGHICIHHGTSPHIVCDIYLYIKGTSIHTVWDISHYNMRHISTVWDIYLCSM